MNFRCEQKELIGSKMAGLSGSPGIILRTNDFSLDQGTSSFFSFSHYQRMFIHFLW